jgi:hypothetical protein
LNSIPCVHNRYIFPVPTRNEAVKVPRVEVTCMARQLCLGKITKALNFYLHVALREIATTVAVPTDPNDAKFGYKFLDICYATYKHT